MLAHRLLAVMGLSGFVATSAACKKDRADEAGPAPALSASVGGQGGSCSYIYICTRDTRARCEPELGPGSADGLTWNRGQYSESLTTETRKKRPGVCCYQEANCGFGRPLRSEDGLVVAADTAREDWLPDEATCAPGAVEDPRRAAEWLREAALEHASIASFARTSLQLLALGAPADLVADTHRAAQDEIEHARMCYGLALRHGAGERGPTALAVERAPLGTTIEAFVADTFLDGCVAETEGALAARARVGRAYDDHERRVLARIADDEERHAELAWRSLAWALRAGGSRAREALSAAVASRDLEPTVIEPCARALLTATA